MRIILFTQIYYPGHFDHIINSLLEKEKDLIIYYLSGLADKEVVEKIKHPERFKLFHMKEMPIQSELFGRYMMALYLQVQKKIFDEYSKSPDLIIMHVGSGLEIYVKDVFHNVPIIGLVEWFFPSSGDNIDTLIDYSAKNKQLMNSIDICAVCVCATKFQRNSFPEKVRSKILVSHEGIDLDFFSPKKRRKRGGVRSQKLKVITYVSRGLEPIRGFLEFIQAIKKLFEYRNDFIVNIVGNDYVYYETNSENISYMKKAREILGSFSHKVNFLGKCSKNKVRDIFRESDLHVYFNRDYVVSWSLVEAMATGCLMLTSNDKGSMEFVVDGKNGFNVDYKNCDQVFEKMNFLLDMDIRDKQLICENSRRSVRRLDINKSIDFWMRLIETVCIE